MSTLQQLKWAPLHIVREALPCVCRHQPFQLLYLQDVCTAGDVRIGVKRGLDSMLASYVTLSQRSSKAVMIAWMMAGKDACVLRVTWHAEAKQAGEVDRREQGR